MAMLNNQMVTNQYDIQWVVLWGKTLPGSYGFRCFFH